MADKDGMDNTVPLFGEDRDSIIDIWLWRIPKTWRRLCLLASIVLAILCFAVPVIALPLAAQIMLVVAPTLIVAIDRYVAHLKFDEIPFWEKALYYGVFFVGLVVLAIATVGVGPLVIPGVSLGVEELCIAITAIVGLAGFAVWLENISLANQVLASAVFYGLFAAALVVFAVATHGVGLLVLPKFFAPWLALAPGNWLLASAASLFSAYLCWNRVGEYRHKKQRERKKNSHVDAVVKQAHVGGDADGQGIAPEPAPSECETYFDASGDDVDARDPTAAAGSPVDMDALIGGGSFTGRRVAQILSSTGGMGRAQDAAAGHVAETAFVADGEHLAPLSPASLKAAIGDEGEGWPMAALLNWAGSGWWGGEEGATLSVDSVTLDAASQRLRPPPGIGDDARSFHSAMGSEFGDARSYPGDPESVVPTTL